MVPGEIFVTSIVGAVVLVSALASLAAIAVFLYAFYDLLLKRPEMRAEEKILWILAIVIFNVLGAIVYLIAVWSGYNGLGFDRDLSELERLAELRENGAITEDEYQELKEEVMEDLRNQG